MISQNVKKYQKQEYIPYCPLFTVRGGGGLCPGGLCPGGSLSRGGLCLVGSLSRDRSHDFSNQ